MAKNKSQENNIGTEDGAVKAEKRTDKAKNAKLFTVITYAVALLCLLAGLFAPLIRLDGGKLTDKMLFAYSLGIINALVYPFTRNDLIKLPEGGFFKPYGYPTKFSSEVLALTVLLVTCVLGLIMLIPVIAGNKDKKAYIKCANAVEVLGALSSGYFIFSLLINYTWGGDWRFFNLLIPFGGCLLVMCIQAVYRNGGLGVSKIILTVLSGLIFMFLIDLGVAFSDKVGNIFDNLSNTLGLGETALFATGYYKLGIQGITFVDTLKSVLTSGASGIDIMALITVIVGGLLTCMLLFNFAMDIIQISTGDRKKGNLPDKNKAMSVSCIIRYAFALLLAIAFIVLLFIGKEAKPGLMLYLVTALVLIQLIFCIVRAVILSSKYKKAQKKQAEEAARNEEYRTTPRFDEEPNEEAVTEPDAVFARPEQSDMAYEQPVQPEAAPAEEPAAEPAEEPAQTEEVPAAQPAEKPETPGNIAEEPVQTFEEPAQPEAAYEPAAPVEPAQPYQTSFMAYEQPAEEPAPAYEPVAEPVQPVDESEEQLVIPGTAAPARPEPAGEEHTYVYTYRPKYEGPTDKFMQTLNDAEKIEFVQLFLEKTKGKIKGVPDYKMGEDNSMFFSSIFIHINRSREIISTNLLEKIYKQLNSD